MGIGTNAEERLGRCRGAGKNDGARLRIRDWGPEDWGDEAPTMAMLTTSEAREQHVEQHIWPTAEEKAKENVRRGGPIWRAIFGGLSLMLVWLGGWMDGWMDGCASAA